MSLSLFAGEVEGVRIAAAHSLIPKEQIRAAGLLNQLTPRDFQFPDKNGWLGVTIAPELDSEYVAGWLSQAGIVEWNPDIPRTQVEAVLGHEATSVLLDNSAQLSNLELPD